MSEPAKVGLGRLLILSTEFPPGPGGIGTHAYQLALHLSRRGWVIQVVTPQAYVSENKRDRFNGEQPFSIVSLSERAGGLSAWRQRLGVIAGTIRDFRPDVVIASGRRALWAIAAVRMRFAVPWVAIVHGSELDAQSASTQFLTTQALARASAVVAVSDYTARLVEQTVSPNRIVVIPNGADGDRFAPTAPDPILATELDIAGKRILLTVGHVSDRKAQDVVIRALPQVLDEHPDVVYVMVGLPTRRSELQALADELGVGDHIRFAGSVPDDRLVDFYNLSDLFVLVSRQAADGAVEGYGIVVKEAALCGKPAIVSQGCGLTEAIEEGVTGLSVPPDDPAATARAINSLLEDDTARLMMGQKARDLAVQTTWAHRVADYDRLLREIVPPVTWAAPLQADMGQG